MGNGKRRKKKPKAIRKDKFLSRKFDGYVNSVKYQNPTQKDFAENSNNYIIWNKNLQSNLKNWKN